MNRKAIKKLSYYVAGMAFSHEVSSTLDMLKGLGIDATFEDAEKITHMASDYFDDFLEKSDGWDKLVKFTQAD